MTRLGLLGLALTACMPPTTARVEADDTAGAAAYDGPWRIAVIEHTCAPADADVDGATDQWTWTVRTNGWAGQVDLTLADTTDPLWPTDPASVATEVHPLDNLEYDAAGAWDAWRVTLNAVPSADAVRAGSTTEWGCADDDAAAGVGGTLAWMAVMLDASEPPDVMDCAMQGHEASAAFAEYDGVSCACLDLDTDCSN